MSKKGNEVEKLAVGLDLGNGYIKANINNKISVNPSLAAKQYNVGADSKVLPQDVPEFMKDVYNRMDVSFSSPLVRDTVRRLFGERALTSTLPLEEYDVFSPQGKAEVDITGALNLATISSYVLREHFETTGGLPVGPLTVNVSIALALPILEHRGSHASYRQRLLNAGQAHRVTFHNFEEPVHVDVVFEKVHVANEGEAAQYGLMFADGDFLKRIANDARKGFPNGELDDVTGQELVAAVNTLGIDIGEGTIDFALFTKSRFNVDASTTMNQGYGNVLESGLDRLRNEGYPYKSRKELGEFVHTAPSRFNTSKWSKVNDVVNGEAVRFSDMVVGEVSKVFSRVGSFVEVIFVYGGGAAPLEPSLYPKLRELVASFGGDDMLPVVYLESAYSRFLNVQGLYQLAVRL